MKRIFSLFAVISSLMLYGHPALAVTIDVSTVKTDSGRCASDVTSVDSCKLPDIFCSQDNLMILQNNLQSQQNNFENLYAQLDMKRLSEKDREAWGAYQRANSMVLDQQWKQAADAMAEVERQYSQSLWADDARFWNTYALEKNGQPLEEVFREYEDFIKKYPKSKWVDTARSSLISIGNRLAASGKPEYAEKIRPFSESENVDIALTALIALRNMGDESLPDIIKLYNSTKDSAIREYIVTSLSFVHTSESIDFLISIAEKDSCTGLRRKALFQLRNFSMTPANASSFIPTVSSTTTYGGMSFSKKTEITEQDRDKIIAALKRIARKDRDDDIRRIAITMICQSTLKNDDIQYLETTVSCDPNPDIRRNILLSIFNIPDNRGIPSVISIAKSNSQLQIRKQAIQLLGTSKDPRARTALIEIASGK